MPKIHLDSILIYIGFVILIILAIIIAVNKVVVHFQAESQVSMYSKPTWPEITTEETFETSEEETEEVEESEEDEDEEYEEEE